MSCKEKTAKAHQTAHQKGGSHVDSTQNLSGRSLIVKIITDQVVKAMEQGIIPWQKPWVGGGLPKSLATGKPYRGLNALLLNLSAVMNGYTSGYWATWDKIRQMGGRVKEGQEKKYTIISYYQSVSVPGEDEDGNPIEVSYPLLRYYRVYNLDQTEGIPRPSDELPPGVVGQEDALEAVENAISLMPNPPQIFEDSNKAYYDPQDDSIHLPSRTRFVSLEEYYATKLHEIGHSTGAAHRLNRPEIAERQALTDEYHYGVEELTAELFSAYACGYFGINNEKIIQNQAAYLNGWINAIQENREILIKAGQRASKALDYFLSAQLGEINEENTEILSIAA